MVMENGHLANKALDARPSLQMKYEATVLFWKYE
jgi:hypothetical protein